MGIHLPEEAHMIRGTVTWLVGATLACAVLLTAAGAAYPHSHPWAGRAQTWQPPLERLQAALGLSDDQVGALRQLHEGRRAARRELFQNLQQARQALRELVYRGADEASIQAKTTELQELLTQAVQMRLDTMQGMAQILTPEQREKLLTLPPPMPWRRHGPRSFGQG